MQIFPKTISERTWREHLATFSHTIVHHTERHATIIESAGHKFIPYNLYVCPLCVENYFYVTPDGVIGNAQFSLDHLPPDSVGGKFKVLTCKKCNNNAGVDEAELIRLVNFGEVPDKRQNSILPYTYVINPATGEKFPVQVTRDGTKVDFKFDERVKLYNENLKKFIAGIHKGEHPQLKLHFSTPNLDKVSRSFLKSAYLVCFVWFGYEFAFSENGELLRQAIEDRIVYPTRVPTVWQPIQDVDDTMPPGVSILEKNGERLAFVVTIHIKSSKEKFQADILIPPPFVNGWQQLSHLDQFATGKELTDFECLPIPRIVHRMGYSVAWGIVSWRED